MVNDAGEVIITLYDLLGYVVREWKKTVPGAEAVNQDWFGDNEIGDKVSKGGYICRIQAKTSKGTQTVIRKIAVLH